MHVAIDIRPAYFFGFRSMDSFRSAFVLHGTVDIQVSNFVCFTGSTILDSMYRFSNGTWELLAAPLFRWSRALESSFKLRPRHVWFSDRFSAPLRIVNAFYFSASRHVWTWCRHQYHYSESICGTRIMRFSFCISILLLLRHVCDKMWVCDEGLSKLWSQISVSSRFFN